MLLDMLWSRNRKRFLELSRRAAAYCARQDRAEWGWYGEYIYHACIGRKGDVIDLVLETMRDWHWGPDFLSRCVADIPRVSREHAAAGRVAGLVPSGLEFWMAMTGQRRHRFRIALAFEGGGALCAYQAGIYEALHDAGMEPDWFVGESLGAVNAAIIAGNPVERRVDRLHEFWEMVSVPQVSTTPTLFPGQVWQQFMGLQSALFGVPGLYAPVLRNPWDAWLNPDRFYNPTSYYDLTPLLQNLYRFVDFDRLNSGEIHYAASAVNVATGNLVVFDNLSMSVRPEHVVASVAMPPSAEAVKVDGDSYWTGSLVSSTPLQQLLSHTGDENLLVLQPYLFSASQNLPTDGRQVEDRQQNIQYSSRARFVTDYYAKTHSLRQTLKQALNKVPKELLTDRERELQQSLRGDTRVSLVNLIYRPDGGASNAARSDFSRHSVMAHWTCGRDDTRRMLAAADPMADGREDETDGIVVHTP